MDRYGYPGIARHSGGVSGKAGWFDHPAPFVKAPYRSECDEFPVGCVDNLRYDTRYTPIQSERETLRLCSCAKSYSEILNLSSNHSAQVLTPLGVFWFLVFQIDLAA